MGDALLRKPISGFVGCCCARTAGGHTTAVLPRNVMNSRRLMASPTRELHLTINITVLRLCRSIRPSCILSGPPAPSFLKKHWALKPGLYFNIKCAAFSRFQHAFPTPRHAQPELAVSFVRSSLSEPIALLYLLLKEFAFIMHHATETKMLRKSGAPPSMP